MKYTKTQVQQLDHKIGVLMINLGTPDSPDPDSVRRYLREFLADPRVVEKPRWLWWLILNLIVLRIRPSKSAKAYRKIWTEAGSPILVISRRQTDQLQRLMNQVQGSEILVQLAMRYGTPSIGDAITRLQEQAISKLLILPMYPQYCASTTASIFDEVSRQLQRRRWIPEVRFINHYYDFPCYIQTLAASVRQSWEQYGRGEKLILSFHGIPQSYVEKGDPYLSHCEKTTALLAETLDLSEKDIAMVFQSRVGREEWLKPYCDEYLSALPSKRIKSIDIISPAFSADCLETLEELDIENRENFLNAGGERYQYIPALNDRQDHMECLAKLALKHLDGWSHQAHSPAIAL